MSRAARDGGFVTAEWSLAVAMVLLPLLSVAATLPGWASTREAAVVAAREASRVLAVQRVPGEATATAAGVARRVLADRGIVDASRVRIVGEVIDTAADARSGSVQVVVEVALAAHGIPFLGRIPLTTVRAEHQRTLEPFRSR